MCVIGGDIVRISSLFCGDASTSCASVQLCPRMPSTRTWSDYMFRKKTTVMNQANLTLFSEVEDRSVVRFIQAIVYNGILSITY